MNILQMKIVYNIFSFLLARFPVYWLSTCGMLLKQILHHNFPLILADEKCPRESQFSPPSLSEETTGIGKVNIT